MATTTRIYPAILNAFGHSFLMTPEMQFTIATTFGLEIAEEFDSSVIARFINKNVKKDIDLDILIHADLSKSLCFKVDKVWYTFNNDGSYKEDCYE